MSAPFRRWLPFLVGAAALVGTAFVVAAHGVGGDGGPEAAGGGAGGSGGRPRLASPARRGRGDARLEKAIAGGVDYLVKAQNKDGSWGSPASNLWDIYAPVPGAYTAFHVAATALALSGLLEAEADGPAAGQAVARASAWLLEHHGKARRVSADTLYNVWAQTYALEAFARLLARERDPARREAYLRACALDVDLLARFEFVDGGWGYYNFDIVAQRPEHGATTFTTAAALTALRMAADQGVKVPRRLVDRALALLETCRRPDWAFEYAWDHRFSPSHPINKWNGSLARTPSCEIAMIEWDHPVPRERVTEALERLKAQGRFLQIARKYPVPHETWFYNSGYFCFFGYDYASMLLDVVPAKVAAVHRASIAGVIAPLQEEDGSFWDYQLYGYHKAYGTGYCLQILSRCRPPR